MQRALSFALAPGLTLLALVASSLACAPAANSTIDVEVVDDQGNPLAGDENIRVDCVSDTLSASNLGLDDDSRFQCRTLNELRVIGADRVINFVIRDTGGRFATHEEAAILDEGEELAFSIQLERAE